MPTGRDKPPRPAKIPPIVAARVRRAARPKGELIMDIYGSILSPFVARCILAARFKGIKHTFSMPKDGIKSPAFLKLNPLGKMPAMKDGKLTLFESSVIAEYINGKSKKKPLVPSAAKAAAKVRLARSESHV